MEPTPSPPTEDTIFPEEEFSMEGYDKHIRNARILLFVLAGLTLINMYVLMPIGDNPVRIIAAIFVGMISATFVALGLWSKKKPFNAILTALILYVSLQVLGGIVSPVTIFQGWLIKIAAIVLLILGLRNAKQSQDMQNIFRQKKF